MADGWGQGNARSSALGVAGMMEFELIALGPLKPLAMLIGAGAGLAAENEKEEEEISPSEDLMREHGVLNRILETELAGAGLVRPEMILELESVAARFGTPCYVYSSAAIRDQYKRLNDAMRTVNGLCFCSRVPPWIHDIYIISRSKV